MVKLRILMWVINVTSLVWRKLGAKNTTCYLGGLFSNISLCIFLKKQRFMSL